MTNMTTTSGSWCQACDTEAIQMHPLEYICFPHARHADGACCDRWPFMALRGITEIFFGAAINPKMLSLALLRNLTYAIKTNLDTIHLRPVNPAP